MKFFGPAMIKKQKIVKRRDVVNLQSKNFNRLNMLSFSPMKNSTAPKQNCQYRVTGE
jgi:hypothetical protein